MPVYIEDFRRLVGAESQKELYNWSVENFEDFWSRCADFCGLGFHDKPEKTYQPGDTIYNGTWFPGGTLSYAEHMLRGPAEKPAIVELKEQGGRKVITFGQLREDVARLANGLTKAGVKKGDRVCALVPNCARSVTGLLAANSIGALWSSCSPDFGIDGICDRFSQIEPKVFITVDGYHYNGKRISILETVQEVKRRIPSIEHVVISPFLDEQPELLEGQTAWDNFVSDNTEQKFEQLPFNHPLYILYSSGTTGAPKCIVHSAGGSLLQHLKEHKLHTNVDANSNVFYFTTCGWMMWNWLISALALDATIFVYDGSPFCPGPERLWKHAEEEGFTEFGTSAKYLAALQNVGYKQNNPLPKLKTIMSTGSPLLPEQFDYIRENIKPDVNIASISGGTDIVSCFALGNPALPVNRGELQTRGLGMAVEVWDENGTSIQSGCGELVCTKPFPSMPVGFWNDEDNSKYKSAYFDAYENIWHHGDWVELTENDGMIFHGRSDAVLNPGGVRIGTAELYRQIEQLPEIEESIVVGQQWQGDERVILFVKLNSGFELNDELSKKIKTRIRSELTPRHVPSKIIEVSAIPRTRSGKISELAVKNIIHGRPVKNTNALLNPESLSQFENLAQLND